MLEHMDKLAETSALAISNIKFDKVIVWENGSQNGKSSTANFLQGMTQTLPPMLQVMKEIGGVEMPEILGRLMPDLNTNGATATAKPSKTDGASGSAQPEQQPPSAAAQRPHQNRSS